MKSEIVIIHWILLLFFAVPSPILAALLQQHDAGTTSVRVTVLDRDENPVSDVPEARFEVTDDGKPQAVTRIERDPSPASLGILLDLSASTREASRGSQTVEQLAGFLAKPRRGEYFLFSVNIDVRLVQDFAPFGSVSANEIQSRMPRSGGGTALYDGVQAALEWIRKGKYDKKALVVISDLEDTSSRIRLSALEEEIKHSDVQVNTLTWRAAGGQGSRPRPSWTKISGGQSLIGHVTAFSSLLEKVMTALEGQSILYFRPEASRTREKWRKLQVRIPRIKGQPELIVLSRNGYYP